MFLGVTSPQGIALAAHQELTRVLGAGVLTGAQARLLQHVVERSLSGDRESLKEYAIGLDVFGRPPSFDPKADSIVRTTARQLRLKLAEYYQSAGSGNPVRISLPKGPLSPSLR